MLFLKGVRARSMWCLVRIRDQAKWRLEVSDDGIGLPSDIDVEHVNSMGLQLIQLLAQQVGGSLEVIRDGGTRFTIRFPRNA